MGQKKNSTHDVFKKSSLYLGFGLCLSLLLVITAFEWKFYEEDKFVDLDSDSELFEEILDIPVTEQPPPPPPIKSPPPIIEEVPEEEIIEEIEIDLDVEVTEDQVIEIFVASEPLEEEFVEEILTVVEEMPSPVGGYPEFYKFIGQNITYPAMAKKAGIEGRVILEITISKEGKLAHAVVAKGIGYGCDAEALRVIKLWEEWNPGKQRGISRTIRMFVPLIFQFTD
jgi:protein TonB